MNAWREWVGKIKDPACDVYERRYRLFLPIGIGTVSLWLIAISVLDFDLLRLTFFLGMLILYVLSAFIAVRSGNIRFGAVFGALGMACCLQPFVFFTEGGISAGAFNYFITSLIFVLMTLGGRMRTLMLLADAAAACACFVLGYLHPDWVQVPSRPVAYLNAFTEMTVTGVMAFSSLMFQFYVFRQERVMLERQRREIEELNRAQNRFFSGMSHEIRTPLNSIIGLNEMNLRDGSVSDEVRTNSRNIRGASRMLLALINDILDMSKMESGRMEIVPVSYDTGTLLSDVVNMIWGPAEEKKLQFRMEVDPALPKTLYGDEVRIRQVLINLLNNAVKYTKEGSVRLVVLSDRPEEGRVRLIFRVEDTGAGIKKEAMPHLFDAFKRIDEEKNRNIEGTGLGLAIVKQLADLMDAEISVDSVYMQGTVFTFSLVQEIVDEDTVDMNSLKSKRFSPEQDAYRQSFEAPSASLLIVDDNELNLQVERSLLAATRMQIDTASSAKECLSKTFLCRYDAIFMDHLMPGMDGIEALKEIRSQRGGLNRETPVIVLTANAGSENRALYEASGFDGYLLKPVSGAEMEAALALVLPDEKLLHTGAATLRADRESMVGSRTGGRRILVTCESGADLPADLVKKYQIPVISFLVHTEEGVFYDGLDLDSDGLLSYLEADAAGSVRTTPPSVAEYERFFAEQLVRARHIVHITFGEKLTEGFRNAKEAAASFDNVTVFDSENLSGGAGLLVLYAIRLAEREENVEAFLERLARVRKQMRAYMVLDSARFPAEEGRIPHFIYLLTDALTLHPALTVENGRLRVARVFSGVRAEYRRRFIRYALGRHASIDHSLLYITYAGLSEEELSQILNWVAGEMAFDRVFVQKASGAMTANSGKGSFGLMFRTRDEEEAEDLLYDFLPRRMRDEEERERTGSEEGGRAELPAEDTKEREAEESALHAFYRSSEALDYEEAMRHLSDEAMLRNVLAQFYETIPQKEEELGRLLAAGDYEGYRIRVHALKSASLLIGAKALSEQARRLEEAGKTAEEALSARDAAGAVSHPEQGPDGTGAEASPEEAWKRLREEGPVLLSACQALHEELRRFFGEDAGEEKPVMEEEELSELYEAIAEFAENYDADSVERLLLRAREYEIPEPERERFLRVKDCAERADWEGLREAIAEGKS